MKKWLSFLGTILIISSSTTSVIACNYEKKPSSKEDELRELSSVVKNINLGSFNKIPNDEELLKQIEQLNSELDISQLEIISHENQKVVLGVISNSKIYFKSTITLFYLLTSLDIIINQTDLGVFNNIPTDQEIIARIKELNSDLDISQIIVSNITNVGATINVIPDSKIYGQGTIEVSYKIDNRNDLKEVLKNINLRSFKTVPTNEELLKRIGELNPDVDISQLVINSNENEKVIVSVIPNSILYLETTINLFYVLDLRIFLDESHLKVKHLGFFEDKPSDKELLERVKQLNHELDITQLFILSNENKEVILNVIENSKIYYQMTIKLTYNIIVNLDEFIKENNLGVFKKIPTEQEIMARIKELNFNVDISQLEISHHENEKVILNVIKDSEIYYQTIIEIIYIIDSRINLTEVMNETYLGDEYKELLMEQEILSKIKLLNPDVDITQIVVDSTTIWIGGATISVITGSKVYFDTSVKITFIIDKRLRLKEVMNETNLGSFLIIPNKKDILYRTLYLNQEWQKNVNLDKVEQEWEFFNVSFTKENEALISISKNSEKYFPSSFNVYYEIDQNIPQTKLHPEFKRIIEMNDFEFNEDYEKWAKDIFFPGKQDPETKKMLFVFSSYYLFFIFRKNQTFEEFLEEPSTKEMYEKENISIKEVFDYISNDFIKKSYLFFIINEIKTKKYSKSYLISAIEFNSNLLQRKEIKNNIDNKIILQNIIDYFKKCLALLD